MYYILYRKVLEKCFEQGNKLRIYREKIEKVILDLYQIGNILLKKMYWKSNINI